MIWLSSSSWNCLVLKTFSDTFRITLKSTIMLRSPYMCGVCIKGPPKIYLQHQVSDDRGKGEEKKGHTSREKGVEVKNTWVLEEARELSIRMRWIRYG